MRYYKIIVDNNVVGVGTSFSLRKYQIKHKIIVMTDENHANYIQYKDDLFHDNWMLEDTHALFTLAEVIEIKQGEYDSLEIILDKNGVINIEVETEPEEQKDPEIADEDRENIEFEKSKKIGELSKNCNAIIERGFDVILSDNISHHFSLTTNDQLNLITLSSMLASGENYIPYHADGELCVFYSPNDVEDIIEMATQLKMYHTTYFNSLKSYVNSLNNISDIQRINYGVAIPEEYESEVLKQMYSI